MSRPCSVCRDPRRGSIDTAVLAGEPLRAIAGRFSLAKSTLSRHAPHLQTARQAAEDAHILDVVEQLRAINSVAVHVLREARAAGDGRLQLQACGTVQRQVEFVHQVHQDRHLEQIEARLSAIEQGLTMRQNGHQEVAWSGRG